MLLSSILHQSVYQSSNRISAVSCSDSSMPYLVVFTISYEDVVVDGRKRVCCRLLQHEVVVCEYHSRSRKDAKYQVSVMAVPMLVNAKEEYTARCTCARKKAKADIMT